GEPNGGLLLPTDTFTRLRLELILDAALRLHLPAIGSTAESAKKGGLLTYNSSSPDNLRDQFRQAAGYVDRILKGAKPGDLPVQQESRYILVINLKTAKQLGLTVPPTLQYAADEVIE